jgi:hypothetical protein
MPILTTILGIAAAASAASGVAGAVEGAQAGGRQQKALTIQEQIAQQEAADKQQVFNQAESFYTPYTQSGSPFLQNIQAAAAGQGAQQGNNAAGTFRQQMGQTGLGFGPSGSTAAGLANIGAGQAQSGAANYLMNLLNNEQIKFQAQQGLVNAGSMAGSSQNQPNVSAQLPYQSLGSGLTGLAGVLQNLLTQGQQGNQVPNTANIPSNTGSVIQNSGVFGPIPGVPTFPTPGSSGGSTPTTGGWVL